MHDLPVALIQIHSFKVAGDADERPENLQRILGLGS
jgi:hypothetical protein